MCISKRIKWIKKKSHREKKFFCIFFQSPHQVDMKNVVKCPREFIAYFNALETTCDPVHLELFHYILAVKNLESGHHAFVVNNTIRLHIALKNMIYFTSIPDN